MTSPSDHRIGEEIAKVVSDTVTFARVMERISNSALLFTMAAKSLEAIAQVDPALSPEIFAALAALEEVQDQMLRATNLLEARYEATKTRFAVFAAEEEARQ